MWILFRIGFESSAAIKVFFSSAAIWMSLDLLNISRILKSSLTRYLAGQSGILPDTGYITKAGLSDQPDNRHIPSYQDPDMRIAMILKAGFGYALNLKLNPDPHKVKADQKHFLSPPPPSHDTVQLKCYI
jgi:hypothetical protein